ncbi:MAG: hypothetical protein PVJ04_14600, partial [Gemmatimonadota bacterium]
EWLRDLALAASKGETSPLNPGEEAYLRDALLRWSIHPPRAAEALVVVDEARTLAAGNVNPQLIVFGLVTALREVLTNQGTASSIREMK